MLLITYISIQVLTHTCTHMILKPKPDYHKKIEVLLIELLTFMKT